MMRPRLLVAVLALAAACDVVDPTLGPTFTPGPAPTPTAQAWLDAHNAVRAGTFPGVTVSPVPSPPLAPLGWSASAAAVAQAWAANCVYAHNAGRGSLGENIAATAPTALRSSTDVVGLWASEWSAYDYATNTCSAPPCGHYTQLVWRSTVNVGCALVTCSTNWPFGGTPPADPRWDFWVCDYEPPGNYVGERPY
ncbi:MAG TPA: CAP domain-containing protein [Anaeromyxobacteraceae bacterium]|nr:CAP domain-containing protein [Anaeromyxobacteraceae bacterium]